MHAETIVLLIINFILIIALGVSRMELRLLKGKKRRNVIFGLFNNGNTQINGRDDALNGRR